MTKENLDEIYGGKLPPGFIVNNEYYISLISEIYGDGRLALLLGSGVSRQSGIPDWRGLVEEMYRQYLVYRLEFFEDEAEECREELRRADLNKSGILAFIKNRELIEIAQYIKPSTPDQNEGDNTQALCARQVQAIFKERYRKKVNERAHNNVLSGDLEKNENATLYELAQLICPQEKNAPLIHDVITYNYDDLLEGALQNGRFRHKLNLVMHSDGRVVKRFNSPLVHNEFVHVYHVHGLTPVLNTDLACGPIVLNDESYREMESDAFVWGNNKQVQIYKERPTLIIGFSCEDRNFRRLCTIKSSKGRFMPRFAIMQAKDYINGVEEFGKGASAPVEKLLRQKRIAAATILNIYENYLYEQFGIHVVWVYDAAVNVKRVIKRIREKAAREQTLP